MQGAAELPTPLLRALEGLDDGVGRLLLIAGPANSGKSALFDQLRERLTVAGVRVTELQGTYHEREVANAALGPLLQSGEPAPRTAPPDPDVSVPMAALGAMAEEGSSGRSRRRGGERRQGTILGVPYAVRTRGGLSMDPAQYWSHLRDELRAPGAPPVAILVEDGSLLDGSSRDFLLYLSERVRFQPVLIAVTLDVGEPGFAGWEERLLGRSDVDWHRLTTPRSDPREAHRLKQSFDRLGPGSQRILGFAALLGGSTTEVTLSRVSRSNFSQLGDALLPCAESHLVRVEAGKVVIPHAEWAALIREFLPEARAREMHREIAEALEAMSPEPTLARRTELAEHFFQWEPGPTALRYLLEAAELTERLSAFDSVLSLLDEALLCVPALPFAERANAEVELRLFRTRALFFAGRPAAAEAELAAALTAALDLGVLPADLEGLLEALVPALIVAGPRPELLVLLGELADRAQEAGYLAAAVLLLAILAGHEQRRGRRADAKEVARKTGHLSKSLEAGPVQAAALLAVAVSLVDGTDEERVVGERFRQSADKMLGLARRTGFQQLSEELRALGLVRAGDRDAALQAHSQAITRLQRLRLPSLELPHHLGIAELLLDRGSPDERVARALKRAGEIVGLLHLTPPAPALLSLWLLDGRMQAAVPNPEGARDRFRAIVDRPASSVAPRVHASALLLLSELELSQGRESEAREAFEAAEPSAFPNAAKPAWDTWRGGRDEARSGPTAVGRRTARAR